MMRFTNLKGALLAGASAAVLMAAVQAPALADQIYAGSQTKNATAGGNLADSDDSANANTNAGNTFESFTGVASEVQNNGANAALNNGNAVSASIDTGTDPGNVDYSALSGQTATQVGGSIATETNVDDDNLIEDQAFQNAQGVFSKLQNNGSESAINNGNAVAAAILEGNVATSVLYVASDQDATVGGGAVNLYEAETSTNDNDIRDDAFGSTEGVMSVLQNNGPNAALNNGNAVAAVINATDVDGNGDFDVEGNQTARVDGSNSSTETTNLDTNRLRGNAFQNAQGVGSAMQNNGANTAANNGNAVSALVLNQNIDGAYDLDAIGSQDARVDSTPGGANEAVQQADSHDRNFIGGNAFEESRGVFSAMQNNGPNSALNGGNTVAAMISNGEGTPDDFAATSEQRATVRANDGTNSSDEDASDDANRIDGNAFRDPEGIVSATQNNGANTAANNGNTVTAAIANNRTDVDGPQDMLAVSTQNAQVRATNGGTNVSIETGSDDSNLITDDAFASVQGVASALQNNGANSALNNGNTVSAVISGGAGTTADDFRTDSSQTARVDADALGGNISEEYASDNTNTLGGNAFQGAAGVASVLQNNGANSAANNGNTVAAFIISGGVGSAGAPSELQAPNGELTVSQSATVEANASNSGDPDGNRNLEGGTGNRVVEANDITDNAFQNAEGVFSVLQNNGANSAINNGNTVSAVISDPDTYAAAQADFDTVSTQTALVTNDDGAGANGGDNTSRESRDGADGNPDTNTVDGSAFAAAKGVMSAAQNNGANSAINNGNTVAAIISDQQANTNNDEYSATSVQSATVESRFGNTPFDGNLSEEANSPDTNTVAGAAFGAAQGVGSLAQNNGANSALNNGNTVSAVITDGPVASVADFAADSRQDARVSARDNTINRDQQGNVSGGAGAWPSDESNRMTGQAFYEAEGVFSAMQNNGPNSAANNGNTVAAFITDGTVGLDDESLLDANQNGAFTSRQRATVEGGDNGGTNISRQQGSDDRNSIDGEAFRYAEGIFSALQNNGGNSALNNGNTVAAVIAESGIANEHDATLTAGQVQQARVNADAGGNESYASDFAGTAVASLASNRLTNDVFSGAEGVFSVLQNNGANSAINNGNAVTAFITQGTADIGAGNDFTVDSTQTARVEATGGGLNFSLEEDASHDSNLIDGDAFNGTQGVASITQNNGANSAINNGNTVAAVFNGSQAAGTFWSGDTSTATVVAGAASSVSVGVSNTNTIGGNAFQGASGVVSVSQNNGANAAINNGNVVAAFIN